MGWFWGSSKGSSGKDDSLSKLDADLRDFLDKEASKHESVPHSTPYIPRASVIEKTREVPKPKETETVEIDPEKPQVPQESLFQDGRYAHLWKTYTPHSTIQARGKSDQEKLSDIVSVHNDKKAAMKALSMESCAIEQLAYSDCLENGGVKAQLTMCREENRTFIRCFELQAKFLKVLGYLDAVGKDPELEDRIQVHADNLYRRMIKQEKAIKQAKEEGKPPPEFPPVLSQDSIAATLQNKDYPLTAKPSLAISTASEAVTAQNHEQDVRGDFWGSLTEERRKELEKRLEGKTDAERELEKAEIRADLITHGILGKELEAIFAEERKSRHDRRAQGQETIGDVIKRLWGGW